VTRTGTFFQQEYSFDGVVWVPGASFSQAINMQKLGFFASNAIFAGSTPAHTVEIDYFENLLGGPINNPDNAPVIDTLPPVIHSVQAVPSANSIQVSWKTDEPSTGIVENGVTAFELPPVNSAVLTTMHSVNITGLAADTDHNIRIVAEDASMNQVVGPTFVVRTLAPVVTTVDFTTVAQSIDEDGGTINVGVQLNQPATQVVTVPYSLSGTAGTPADYSAAPGAFSIPIGQVSADIVLTIVDDLDDENDEIIQARRPVPSWAS